jgi:phosphate transport system substrate-binding protein
VRTILASALLAVLLWTNIITPVTTPPEKLEGTISISGAFALYPLTVKWAEEFRKIHPEVRIDISAGGAGKGMTDVLSGIVDIAMVSREINPAELNKGAWPFAVTKDAVVPTISASNPNLSTLLNQGMKRDDFIKLWISGKVKSWSQIGSMKFNSNIHVYTRSDACGAAETWAKYLGKKQEDLLGVGVYGDPGLAQAVKKDPSGIGFNNIVYVLDAKTKRQTNGVRVLPIDINNNGKIDPEESFYDDVFKIIEAISNGRYPSPPARDLYLVTNGKPKQKATIEFIKWVLTEGQKYVHETGYITLPSPKLQKELEKLNLNTSSIAK